MYVHQIGKLGVHVFSMTSMGIAKESKAAAKNDEGDEDEKRGIESPALRPTWHEMT